jgi:hypothetical protein
MDRDLHLFPVTAIANPNDPEARLSFSAEDADHVARPHICVQARQQRPTKADITGVGFLQESFPLGIDAPDQERQLDGPAAFATAIEGAKDFHDSPFTVALPDVGVNSVSARREVLGEGHSPDVGNVPKGTCQRL